MTVLEIRSSALRIPLALLLFLVAGFLAGFPSAGLAGSIAYTYDELNRLTSVVYSNGHMITYTYDPAGNRLSYHGTQVEEIVPTLVFVTSDKGVVSGGTVVLEVVAVGASAYQWYRGESGDLSDPVEGATGPELEVSAEEAGPFWVNVLSADGLSAGSHTITVERALTLLVEATEGGVFFLSFPTVSGRKYNVWGSPDLRNWTLHDTVTGDGSVMNWVYNMGQFKGERQFFKIEILID